MDDTVIEARDLTCRYGDVEAVRGIDLAVERGTLFALLGTNGAGKTTTLETLEGHRAPDAGAVRVLGRDPVRDRPRLRPRVGILLQNSGFAGELTVAETVELWASLRRRAGDPALALERVELAHRRDIAVARLSGGERRRLDLALAVLTRPEVLFLDEPTTGLDPESRRRTWDVVRELLTDGTTVLLTTHYLEEAEALAHRLAIMNRGRIAVRGTLDEIVAGAPARIACTLPAGVDPPHLGDGVPVVTAGPGGRRTWEQRTWEQRTWEQRTWELRTWELQRDLTALLGWAAAHHVALERIDARHASLDDVFRGVVSPSPDTGPDAPTSLLETA